MATHPALHTNTHLALIEDEAGPVVSITLGADSLDCELSYEQVGKFAKALVDLLMASDQDVRRWQIA